jgi:hypothetical protein
MRFSSLLRRLRVLEPASARQRPWPPTEGSFSYWLWDALGRPCERRSYVDMYLDRAKQFWDNVPEIHRRPEHSDSRNL